MDDKLTRTCKNKSKRGTSFWCSKCDAKPCYATDYTHARCKYSVNRGWTEDTKFYIPTATLGDGKLTAEQVRDAIRKHAHDDSCYIFEVYGEECDAIADELNAVWNSRAERTCHKVIPDEMEGYVFCSECGAEIGEYGYPNYCQNCGCKVVGE